VADEVGDQAPELAGITRHAIGHLPAGRTGGYEACWCCCSHSSGETWLRVL
jgi:hypothetical protein